jgi:hypothetical protein
MVIVPSQRYVYVVPVKIKNHGRKTPARCLRVLPGVGVLLLGLSGLLLLCGGCATAPSSPSPGEEPAVTEEQDRRENQDVPEPDPLLTINAIVLVIHRTAADTVIILPPSSFISDYLRDEPGAVSVLTPRPERTSRILFRFNLDTSGVPPFVSEPDRYRYPELYQ